MLINRKKLIISIFILSIIFSLNFVSATLITIKYKPEHNISIWVINPVLEKTLHEMPLKQDTSESGVAEFDFETTHTTLAISATVRKQGKIVKRGTFGNYSNGNSIYIDMRDESEKPKPIVEEPKENKTQENITQETITVDSTQTEALTEETENIEQVIEDSNQSSKTTGAVISDTIKKIPSYVYYIIAIVLVLVIVLTIVLKLRHKNPDSFKVTKLSEKKAEVPETKNSEKQEQQRQDDIDEADDKIDKIDEKIKKLEQAKQRYLEAKKELEELED